MTLRAPRISPSQVVRDELERLPARARARRAASERWTNGLARVKVVAARREADYRRAAVEGRLIVGVLSARSAPPGVSYSLLTRSADEQFGELLEVFGLRHAVESGESRCGICNARSWRTLRRDDVRGCVPPEVLEAEAVFYQCGSCGQMFWPGEKYTSTMGALKEAATRAPARAAAEPGVVVS